MQNERGVSEEVVMTKKKSLELTPNQPAWFTEDNDSVDSTTQVFFFRSPVLAAHSDEVRSYARESAYRGDNRSRFPSPSFEYRWTEIPWNSLGQRETTEIPNSIQFQPVLSIRHSKSYFFQFCLFVAPDKALTVVLTFSHDSRVQSSILFPTSKQENQFNRRQRFVM